MCEADKLIEIADFTGETPLLCGGLVPSPSGLIHSPQFRNLYLNNFQCMWLLASLIDTQQRFLFGFNTFDVRGCCDSIQVFSLRDGGQWSQELSRDGVCVDGNVSCPCSDMFSFVGHRFYLTFTTNNSIVGEGFEIAYDSLGMCS